MILLIISMQISLVAFMTIAQAGVVNSKHNLSSSAPGANTFKLTPGTGTDQVCVFCHTPHYSSTASAPLWNKTVTTTVYTMYSSATIDMTIAGQPQGISAACLSCHDGTVAFDTFLNAPGTGFSKQGSWTWNGGKSDIKTSASAYVSGDLSNDHPISVTYDATKDPAFVTAVNGRVNGLPLYGSGRNQMECASCHDVHDNTNAPFLRAANGGSVLCLKCHIK
jgi:predicted CXXCH cytochrome family protein